MSFTRSLLTRWWIPASDLHYAEICCVNSASDNQTSTPAQFITPQNSSSLILRLTQLKWLIELLLNNNQPRHSRLACENLISQIILQLINARRDLIKFLSICAIPTESSSFARQTAKAATMSRRQMNVLLIKIRKDNKASRLARQF